MQNQIQLGHHLTKQEPASKVDPKLPLNPYYAYPPYHHPYLYGGLAGELRDPYYYPAAYRYGSPTRSRIYDPLNQQYWKPKTWKGAGYTSER